VVGGGERVRHRMGDGDELAVEGADVPAFTVVHGNQLGAPEHPRLLDAVTGEPQRQRRSVDRERHGAQQVGQPAGVVLVRVGEEGRFDPVGVLAQIGEVREDEVDPGHARLGEHDAAVDDQDSVVDLQAEAVPADLAEAAEEDDLDRRATHHRQASGALNMNSSIMGFIARSTSSMRTPSGSRWYANCTRAPSSSRPHSCSGHRSSVYVAESAGSASVHTPMWWRLECSLHSHTVPGTSCTSSTYGGSVE